LKSFAMLAPSCSFPGWTIAEAIERTSDPDQSVGVGGSDIEGPQEMLRGWVGRGELVLMGCFGNPAALPSPIEPTDLLTLDWFGSPASSMIRGVEVFNVRVFPVLNAPNACSYLHDLCLTDVFRRYVLSDPEVVALANLLSRTGNRETAVFADGQAPGGVIDYHWPIDATTASLEYKFTSTGLVIVGDPDPPTPPMISRVSEALASRIRGLRDVLASGQICAFGTFVQTGIEGPIARLQWSRDDISIDVRNGDLCEGQDSRAKPKWTGVSFRMIETPQLANRMQSGSTHVVVKSAPKVMEQIRTKEKSRLECVAWLEDMMSDKQIGPRSKEDLWVEAQSKWPKKLAKRAFLKARDSAIANKDALDWSVPGRKPKSPHS
jgi:hypothetical protein